MASQDQLWRRGACAHYLFMLALLVLLAGCASGDLTESSEPQAASMDGAIASGDLPGLRGGKGRKNRGGDSTALTAVVISPASATLQPGATQRFTASGKLSDGTTTTARVTWTATGGTIDKNGVYTSSGAGHYGVLATTLYTNLADTAAVTVSASAPATLVSISVAPGSATLETGATQRFAASGKLSDGTTIAQPVTWTVTGGTITPDGLYTAGSRAGTYRAIASAEDLADTATVTITAPSDDGSSLPFAPDPPAPLRVVAVSTQSQLVAAVSNAQPGDEIRVASGTYAGGVQFPQGKGGTTSRPIVIRCAPGAVLDRVDGTGYALRIRGPHWYVTGCTLQRAQWGVWAEPAKDGSGNPTSTLTGLVLDRLTIRDIRQNAVVLQTAHGASVQRSTITDVGGYNWTEGLYIGHSTDGRLQSDSVRLLGNRFGPGIVGEAIDIKGPSVRRSRRGLVQGNTIDATGMRYDDSPTVLGAISDNGCEDCQYFDNVITNINSPNLSGLWFDTSVGAVARRNTVDPALNSISGSAYGYRIATYRATSARIYCDNEGIKNVSCTP